MERYSYHTKDTIPIITLVHAMKPVTGSKSAVHFIPASVYEVIQLIYTVATLT